MDVLHLEILNNTIININSKQDIKYNISTIQSILSMFHIHSFQRIPIGDSYFQHFKTISNHFKAIPPQIGVYTTIGLGINDLFSKLL